MIKKEDIKVGLKFMLPCISIKPSGQGFLYYVKTTENRRFGLESPSDVFCVKSVKKRCVFCDIGDINSVRVELNILQDEGLYPEYVEKYMEDWKNSIPEIKFSNGNANEKTDADRFKEITDKMSDTYKRKNHDYGNAFSEMYDELGINYGYGKIREKVNRIKTLKDNEAQVANEPLEDALLDCANYCILTLMEYQKRKEHGTD